MSKLFAITLFLLGTCTAAVAATPPAAPMRVGVVGLVHGHIDGFLNKSNLTPAGGILHRSDVELVGIVEPDQGLFDRYAAKYHLSPALHFNTIAEMAASAHPTAALVFTAPDKHRRIVEECAAVGIHVLMEKPLAFTYADALAIEAAAKKGHIHVLVDFETAWYTSNTEAYHLVKDGSLGPVVKVVVRDGHEGPVKIHVGPDFLSLLIDPAQDGDGALTDFGCYGPNLMTWLMDGEAPISVTAVTKRLQPELYPQVSDEADIILNYKNAVAIVEGSWNWPFALKQMDVYGRTGYAKAIDPDRVEVRKQGEAAGVISNGHPLQAPDDDPIHYMEAVLAGQVEEGTSLSSLRNNILVAEILDAARQSATTGKTIRLPLAK
jgi:predicted dehydrogenase